MYDVVFGYVVGTLVGIVLFRWYVREGIVSATLDMLIQEEYVRSYVDDQGITQLYKWHELDQEQLWDTLEGLLNEMEMERMNETDDSA